MTEKLIQSPDQFFDNCRASESSDVSNLQKLCISWDLEALSEWNVQAGSIREAVKKSARKNELNLPYHVFCAGNKSSWEICDVG